MAPSENFGDTISGGIQDISALLPLLGTDQCEQHVGEALDNGYLYAAVTPLSSFGSLGIVKVSFATLLATMTEPFYGGRWLHDAGFVTTGSVASMVILKRGTKQYGAELQLKCLMKEKHIDDPNMISSLEWFGWKKVEEAGAGILPPYLPWNLSLIITSALASALALLPYVDFALHNQGNTLVWLFPSLRSFGSFLCVVSVQLALQLRIHRITSASLHLMKEDHGKSLSTKEKGMLLEARLDTMETRDAPEPRVGDLEKGQAEGIGEQRQKRSEGLAAKLPVDPVLVILRFCLVAGMGMIVAGYVGCFNLVSQTSTKNGPYIWLGVEAALSVVRTFLWGLNPSWDEQNTGMILELNLRDKFSKASLDSVETEIGMGFGFQNHPDPGSANMATAQMFPIITSPRHLHLLNEELPTSYVGEDGGWRKSFVAHNLEDFLAAASPYLGPLEPKEVDGFAVYYAVIAELSEDRAQKLLCATIVPHGAGWDTHSFLVSGGTTNDRTIYHGAFSSHARPLAGTRALEVAFQEELDDTNKSVLDSKVIKLIVEYSNVLYCQLVAQRSTSRLYLSWSLTLTPTITSISGEAEETRPDLGPETAIPISFLDNEYMRIGQLCTLKGDHCLDRGGLVSLSLPATPTVSAELGPGSHDHQNKCR
ncbi:hypothetical protein PM082_011559 [Marasmius tenuissimus]|nr:hypothetical protein PM082_011559 [Marasmius tenuissimus]